LNRLAALGCPMLGVDPSLVLCYRDEYSKVLGEQRGEFEVLLVHEWLNSVQDLPVLESPNDFYLFSHCTEKTALPVSSNEWQSIFSRFGLSLKLVETGCCGMAGTYGHEKSNLD